MRTLKYTYEYILILSMLILFLVPGNGVHAQLISPGKLSQPHSFLEGISKCTSCHELRKPEISVEKCLNCHTPIRESMEELKGIHGKREVIDQSCSGCHKDHLGANFDILHFDSTDFDHFKETGFKLENAHADVSCKNCHGDADYLSDATVIAYREEYELIGATSTFLGLENSCRSCHFTDNVHGDQFSDQNCESCHTTVQWEGAEGFDHNNSAFQLTGRHIDVTCADCHESVKFEDTLIVRYSGFEFGECTSCHEDEHNGELTNGEFAAQTCESCHITDGWHQFTASFPEKIFPHKTTGFTLLGAHESLECSSCHSSRNDEDINNKWVAGTYHYTYPEPEKSNCFSCHTDFHEGDFVENGDLKDCESCHTVEAWYPSTFGLEEHNTQSTFKLAGAHQVTPCFSCHTGSVELTFASNELPHPEFRFEDTSCLSCHQKDNPHDDLVIGDFTDADASDCDGCHNESAWNSDIIFDHEAETGYALTGSHLNESCSSCHFTGDIMDGLTSKKNFALESTECVSCHLDESVHEDQFEESVIGPSCDNCHNTDSFTLPSFDHNLTSFLLDGAHINVACVDCHTTETNAEGKEFVRFFPLSGECSSCHDDQ